MFGIDYHGDDYAASLNNSKRMLELVSAGKMDSMSILPNMGNYEECMAYLNSQWDTLNNKPLISIHLNLIDGFSVSGCKNPLLCNEKGMIRCSWGKLFLYSYLPGEKRRDLERDIRIELKAQIQRVYGDLPEGVALRLDSHVHTHMIPIVFDSMVWALKDLGLSEKTEFIRVSDEPLMPFLTTGGVAFSFSPVSIVKNRILHFLSGRVNRKLKALGLKPNMLWGLCMTGRMDKERMDRVAKKVILAAQKKDRYLEVICHPGRVGDDEYAEEYGPDDQNFMYSENRDIEYDAVMNRSI